MICGQCVHIYTYAYSKNPQGAAERMGGGADAYAGEENVTKSLIGIYLLF